MKKILTIITTMALIGFTGCGSDNTNDNKQEVSENKIVAPVETVDETVGNIENDEVNETKEVEVVRDKAYYLAQEKLESTTTKSDFNLTLSEDNKTLTIFINKKDIINDSQYITLFNSNTNTKLNEKQRYFSTPQFYNIVGKTTITLSIKDLNLTVKWEDKNDTIYEEFTEQFRGGVVDYSNISASDIFLSLDVHLSKHEGIFIAEVKRENGELKFVPKETNEILTFGGVRDTLDIDFYGKDSIYFETLFVGYNSQNLFLFDLNGSKIFEIHDNPAGKNSIMLTNDGQAEIKINKIFDKQATQFETVEASNVLGFHFKDYHLMKLYQTEETVVFLAVETATLKPYYLVKAKGIETNQKYSSIWKGEDHGFQLEEWFVKLHSDDPSKRVTE
jgi:hypothetical protein